LSRFYLKLGKKKILEAPKSKAKATVDLINYILYNIILILSPIAPFTTEKLYLTNYTEKESAFLNKWPKFNSELINTNLEADFEVATDSITDILNSREKAGIKLRWPIMSATLEVKDDSAVNSLQKLSNL